MSEGYLGDFARSAVVGFKFATKDGVGAPITLAGSPVVSIYKAGSTTESTSGVTLTVDYDSRTGLHHVAIDTSSDGTFYSASSEFTAVLTTGTVNGITVSPEVLASFSLQNRWTQVSLRKNTAKAGVTFVMTNSSTHNPVTGLSVTVTRKIDSGSFGAGTLSSVTEIGNGVYSVDWAAADLNGDVITFLATATAADDYIERFFTTP